MFVRLLKGKIHSAKVTDTKLHYPGSMAIDSQLMEAVGILPYESILVADITNGSRIETYAVPADAGSGEVIVLGAAAHLINRGDRVIILSFGLFSPEEAQLWRPKVVSLDENNKIIKRTP